MNAAYLEGVLAVLVGLAVWSGVPFYRRLVRPRIKGWQGEKRLQELLELFEFEAVHNVYVPNAEGELAQVDHIVKFQNTLGVVETKNFSGEIFAVEYAKSWVQTINGHDYKFPNPLGQAKRQVEHLKNMLPDINIRGTVVYAGDATFTVDTPNDVFTFDEFRHDLAKYKKRKHLHDHSPELDAAWLEVVDQASQTSREMKRKHLSDIHKNRDRDWRKAFIAARFTILALSAAGLGVYRLAM